MSVAIKSESSQIKTRIYQLYRDYFDRAEKKRRWRLEEDIPWNQCNPAIAPAIADVVQTFCTVEMYLPDYLSKLIPQVRAIRGRAWFLANWGYEESRHSLGFGDWLVRSGHRSDEAMADLESEVFSHEWELPYDNARGMVCYTMFQERATWLTYKNLRAHLNGDDPALDRLLQYISIDECAHYDFFRKLVAIYLEDDREATLEQLRHVANTFAMPALHLFADSDRREQQIRELRLFDYDIFYYEVFAPTLMELGLNRTDLRQRQSKREMMAVGHSPS
jgi:acyl-[acyl-carrier-protein] desaturase